MQTRPLGDSGLEFTTVGLGTWAIGGTGWRFAWGQQDDTEHEFPNHFQPFRWYRQTNILRAKESSL